MGGSGIAESGGGYIDKESMSGHSIPDLVLISGFNGVMMLMITVIIILD